MLLVVILLLLGLIALKKGGWSDGADLAESRKIPRYVVELAPGVKLELVLIKDGTFVMGSPEDELGRWATWGEYQRKVVITRPYYLAVFETTQAQYQAIMKRNPSRWKGEKLPVHNVSWQNAMYFCDKLNELTAETRPENYKFTLPTEAQWEYACRAGTETALNNNKNLSHTALCPNLDEVAWYIGNSGSILHEVGLKKSNAWGLYDMHGNAWEYCLDYWTQIPDESDIIDPAGPDTGDEYVKKGGGFYLNAERCRSAARSPQKAPKRYMSFRVALVYAPEKSEK